MKKCPYCGVGFSLGGVSADNVHPKFAGAQRYLYGSRVRDEGDKTFSITSHKCPECRGQIMWLNELAYTDEEGSYPSEVVSTTLLYPQRAVKQVPPGVPPELARDFAEAHDTLEISPKASAALSRRCLQQLVRDREGIHESTLIAEIKKLLALNKLPRYLADDLDAIRNIGNFAAHPDKDRRTSLIVDVEPGEAIWTLEVLEKLLSFYFEEIPKSQARRDALNQKLKDAGKKPMV